ncbi:LacI family DNA-binding transcriptional regulator [Actinomadura sp. NPDC048394]|uniref:LacI family DNA-binding transcriptional regulator n=1 Tax=Actinomadura sp. NPDC048394 TaxID=3158223 RepID=UPI0033E2138C
MEDVAALAGVSAMTVSRALNAPEAVSATTRAKVMAAIESLGYRPNPAARSLATGRSGTIGVLGFDTALYGPAATLSGIERAARRHGFAISVVTANARDIRSVADGVERLRAQSADGIIVVAPHALAARKLRPLPKGLALVTAGAAADHAFPSVTIDHRGGARRATRHLLQLGHATVWHVAGPADWIDAEERIEGWREALTEAGRAAPQPLTGDWTARSGYEAGRRLADDPAVTAVFAANDAMAVGLLRALHEKGRRIPGDVHVVGFDDIPEAAHYWPPLTTVRQDFAGLGDRAFELLLGQLTTCGRMQPEQIIVPELIVRESTAALPA